ncbi:MAG: hypothetical protein ABIF11_00015 [Nitrospirota bacterium]
MAYLMKTSTRFLGELRDFERESYLEGFIFGNPLILSSSEDAPEKLVPVYITGRQEICKIDGQRRGITDLTCLIWEPDLEKYEIWIYELKINSDNIKDVKQLIDYLKAIELPENKNHRDNIVNKAIEMVGKGFIDNNSKIRGALCAQAFSDEVMKKIIEENLNRPSTEKLIAMKIYRFPVDNDVFVLVEPFIGEERTSTGRHITYYDDIPQLPTEKLREGILSLLSKRKNTHPQRFEQLKVLLEIFTKSPSRTVTQDELRTEWQNKDLPREDRGLSVSQLLGYKNNGALRQILRWDISPTSIKDNYKLRDEKYSNVIGDVFTKLGC